MRKKDKLYTANKWNQPLFMSNPNLFGLGDQMNQVAPEGINFQYQTSIPQQGSQLSADKMPSQSIPINGNSSTSTFNWGNVGKGAAIGASFIPSERITINKGGDSQMNLQRGVWDMADPTYWLTGGQNGYKSDAGEGLSNTGVALAKSGNPWLMLAGAGLKITGDIVNARTGTKTNEDLEAQLKGTANYLQNFTSNAGSYEGLQRFTEGPAYQDVYSFGALANRKTRRKVRDQNAELKGQYDTAINWAENSYLNNLKNIQQEQIDNALRNYSAFGGPIDVMNLTDQDMGAAINYGFMADYLTAKQKQAQAKDNNMTNMFVGMPSTMFAKGGGMPLLYPKEDVFYKDGNGVKQVIKAKKLEGTQLPEGSVVRQNVNAGVGVPNRTPVDYDKRYQTYERTIKYGATPELNDTSYFSPRVALGPVDPEVGFNKGYYDLSQMALGGELYGEGGGIHIKPENRGKFNATKKRTGKTTEELTHSKNPLTRKRAIFAQNAAKWHHALGGPLYIGAIPQGGVFALGGDIQTHGADFTDGLVQINAGGSHEINPNEGVQMGVDPKGAPNLVEEGETVFNDYVFSDRINADEKTLEAFHLPKRKPMTYASLSKLLEKKSEVLEKPNDPIAKAGFNVMIQMLQNNQERQKQEMEAQKAQEAFAALSPEEQVAIMQGAQEPIMENPQMSAYGGKIFALGGNFGDELPVELGTDVSKIYDYLVQNGSSKNSDTKAEAQRIAIARDAYLEKSINWNKAKKWLRQEFPNMGNSAIETVAEMMVNALPTVGNSNKEFKPERAFKKIVPTTQFTEDNLSKYLQSFKDKGISVDDAMSMVNKYNVARENINHRNQWNAIDSNLRKQYTQQPSQKQIDIENVETGLSQESFQEETPKEKKPGIFGQAIMNTSTTPYGTQYTGAYRQTGAPTSAPAYATEVVSEVPVVAAPESVQTEPINTTQPSAAPVVNKKDTRYSYYTNVNGEEFPGFTIGEKGIVNNYTPEYDELVNSLKADDLRAWAKDHADDLSYASFRNNGNDITKVTDEEFRKGAHDNKYGFMHYVANSMLQDKLRNEAAQQQASIETSPSEDVFENVLVNDDGTYTSLGVKPIDESLYDLDQTLPPEYGGVKIWRKKPIQSSGIPSSEGSAAEVPVEGTEDKNIVPIHSNENLRYVGLAGPLVGLGMMQAGIGKPDYRELDRAVKVAQAAPALAGYKTLGNYLTYRPMDIWSEQNRLDAQTRATERAIANSNSPSKYAGLLANAYNAQLASGELFRKALEYNDAKKAQVEEFNRGTDQFNAQAYTNNSQYNAGVKNAARQFAAESMANAALHKLEGNASWYNSLYGNVNNAFKGFSELGRENASRNTTADMAAAGLFGVIDPDHFNPNGLLRWETEEERKKRTGSSKACGGKLKK